jgi:hypothetical protein
MKHLQKFESFQPISESQKGLVHDTRITKVQELRIPDPEHGDFKLSVFPFENNRKWISLPEGFKLWEKTLNEIMRMVPLQEGANTHYVTVDSKFFTKPEFLRREGVHADGNFCVDPKFVSLDESKATWGGTKPTWGAAKLREEDEEEEEETPAQKATWGGTKPTWGAARLKEHQIVAKEDNSHVTMDWVLPYKLVIPVGDYISEKKGGIFSVSSEVGCQGWQGRFIGEVLSEGNYDAMKDQLTEDKKVLFEKDSLYFMTSNTPHETLLVDKGKRRTFMRITLNHEYENKNLRF